MKTLTINNIKGMNRITIKNRIKLITKIKYSSILASKIIQIIGPCCSKLKKKSKIFGRVILENKTSKFKSDM